MNVSEQSEPPVPPWGLWDIAKATALVVVSLAAFLAFAVVAARVLETRNLAAVEKGLLFVLTGISEGMLFVAAWVFGVRKYRTSWASLGLVRFRVRRDLLSAVAAVGLFFAVNWLYVAFVYLLGLSSLLPPPVKPLFDGGAGGLVMGLVIAAVIAPAAEEVFFRGFVFGSLIKLIGPRWAAVTSAVLFAVSHLQYQVVIPIFLLGLLLAGLYYRTHSLWSCVIAHALYNAAALIVSFLVNTTGVSVQ